MLINPRISVPCKHCGEKTTIHIKSIDALNTENERLQRELDEANRTIKMMELGADQWLKTNGGFTGAFGDLFNPDKYKER